MDTCAVGRRDALRVTAAIVSSALMPAWAQQPRKVPVVGVFMVPSAYFAVFEQTMRELGYARGKSIAFHISEIERKFLPHHLTTESETQYAGKVPEAAADLVRMKVDVIVVGVNPFIEALRQATQTIPIVMAFGVDPIGQGYIKSYAQPAGNITGLAWEPTPEIFGKLVELLTECVPRLSNIAGIVDPTIAWQPYWKEAENAAKRRGVNLKYVEVQSKDDLVAASRTISSSRAGAVIVFAGPTLWILRTRIADLARDSRLLTVFPYREGVEAGGLISYGPNLAAAWRQVAVYVDKILKGTNPSQLPVEQPAQFELVVNLKTAKALRITVPQSILLRADEVIK